ncbi:MAG TPA: hypothetical protein VEZ11_12720 [Thermoanaerobaculia bacterium]|nr:hypothetical protein [Thermoanaerobaculia bacterium]
MDRGEVNRDPVHDEFFKEQDLADALVREAIQNSLDARRGRSTVRVRFRLATGAHALAPERAGAYLHGLAEHLEAIDIRAPLADEPVPFLTIEDAGTRGLTGDPEADPDLDDSRGEKNDFYFFWRNVGRTVKGELDRGRWGLGKSVFSVASRIRTMFGLTLRADDERRPLLLGQSVLKTHVIDGTKYDPYGFFAHGKGLARPIETKPQIERFVRDFGLARAEPGLSIVVPMFRHEDLTFGKLAESVLRQYFYPITRGDLVVTVEEPGRSIAISSRSIAAVAAELGGDEAERIARLCDLVRWSLLIDAERIVLADAGAAAAPKWDESIIGEHDLDRLRERFENGERLAFRVPIVVKRKKTKRPSWLDLFIEKDDRLKRSEQHFIRRGITIPDVTIRSTPARPVRALVVVDDDALSTLLGDAENPAHADWSERADKVRTLYDHGASTVRFVKNSIVQLSAMLTRPPEGRVRDFLAELFSIDVEESNDEGRAAGAAESEELQTAGNAPAFPPTVGHASHPAIIKTGRGFTIHGSGDVSQVGRTMRTEVAYRMRGGNPFRKYSAFDFDLGRELVLEISGADLRSKSGNGIEFVPTSPDFAIGISGFDPRRDLLVHLSEVNVSEDETDAAQAELH